MKSRFAIQNISRMPTTFIFLPQPTTLFSRSFSHPSKSLAMEKIKLRYVNEKVFVVCTMSQEGIGDNHMELIQQHHHPQLWSTRAEWDDYSLLLVSIKSFSGLAGEVEYFEGVKFVVLVVIMNSDTWRKFHFRKCLLVFSHPASSHPIPFPYFGSIIVDSMMRATGSTAMSWWYHSCC